MRLRPGLRPTRTLLCLFGVSAAAASLAAGARAQNVYPDDLGAQDTRMLDYRSEDLGASDGRIYDPGPAEDLGTTLPDAAGEATRVPVLGDEWTPTRRFDRDADAQPDDAVPQGKVTAPDIEAPGTGIPDIGAEDGGLAPRNRFGFAPGASGERYLNQLSEEQTAPQYNEVPKPLESQPAAQAEAKKKAKFRGYYFNAENKDYFGASRPKTRTYGPRGYTLPPTDGAGTGAGPAADDQPLGNDKTAISSRRAP